MAYERRTITGGVPATTLASGIDSSTLTITIASATGWPTGSVGDFGVVIDRGTASEEKVLVDTRSGTTLTVVSGGRGVDGTTGVTHSSGATIEHCLLARDADEPNAHIADTALDHHTQYLTTGRHDVTARHTFGSALGTPSAAADISTAASAGSGTVPSRSDHVHKIGTGAINSAGMFAAGVVDAAAIAADAVGASEIAAGAVGASELASDAVTTAKILDANVTTAKIADSNVTAAKVADGVLTQAKMTSGYRLTYSGATAPSSPSEGDLWYETDTDRLWIYSGSAWIFHAGKTPVCIVTRSSALTIATGGATVTWNAEEEDADGFHSTVSNTDRILPSIAGLYQFSFSVAFEADTSQSHLRALFNGTEMTRGSDVTDINTGLATGLGTVSFLARCNGTTDYATCFAYHEHGSDRDLSAALCRGTAVWMGT